MILPMDSETDFDYAEVKQEYVKKLNDIGKDTTWSRSKESNLIKKIFRANTPLYDAFLSNSAEELNIIDKRITLAKEDGVFVLTFANSNIQILPYEDCFDLFLDLHLRESHAGFDVMYPILQKYFHFTKQLLECFLQSCNVCNRHKTRSNMIEYPLTGDEDNIKYINLNLTVHIIFLQMYSKRANVNDEFKFMLVYKQMKSGYILLRPLSELDAEEVALELYNIFVDFGPPVEIKTTHANLLRDVLNILQNTPIRYSCQVYENRFIDDPLTYKITEYINTWMETCNESNWAAGCYVVQVVMNTEADKPMEILFGQRMGQGSKLLLSGKEKKEKVTLTSEKGECSRSVPTVSLSEPVSTSLDKDPLSLGCLENSVHLIPVQPVPAANSVKSIACGSDEKSTSTKGNDKAKKEEKKICQVCYREIMFTVQTCGKCNEHVHLFCGQRIAVDIKSFEGFHVVCNNCGIPRD